MIRSELSSTVWNLQFQISKLLETLIEVGEHRLVKNIRKHEQALRFYSLVMDFPFITTVVGPQGVGKSTHVNRMFEIPDNQKLLAIEGRAEQLPILLLYKKENCPDVRLYKKNRPSETMYFEYEDLSYEEARNRSERPIGHEDMCMFWYVDANNKLAQIEPLIVLPGHEYKSPWELGNRIITELSDIIIYTFDMTRVAQKEANILEDWIKSTDINTSPVAMITKNDEMNEKHRTDLEEAYSKYGSVFVGCWEDSKGYINDPEGAQKRSVDEYDLLFNEMSKRISAVYEGPNLERLIEIVELASMQINDARSIIKENTVISGLGIESIIEKKLEKINTQWNKYIRDLFIDKITDNTIAAGNIAKTEIDGFLISEFSNSIGKKLKHWWNSGLRVKDVVEIENMILGQYQNNLATLGNELEMQYKSLSRGLGKSIDSEKTGSSIIEYGTRKIFVDAMSIPVPKIQKEMSDDIISTLGHLSDITDSISDVMDKGEKLKKKIEPTIRKMELERKFKKLSSEKQQELQRIIAKSYKDAGGDVVASAGIAGAGAIEAFAEAGGGGLITGAGSLAAGIAGGVIAVVGAGLIARSISRTSNKTEWDAREYAHEVISALSRNAKEKAMRDLDRFWQVFINRIEENLRICAGLESDLENLLKLSMETNAANMACNEVLKLTYHVD